MIRILEDRVVNQIAAGEVVARPASVVKELVENALDAGARLIRIELTKGGCESIRVRDDGRGMTKTDATMCLERHATSKIRAAEDLVGVRTLGFRGEAIPSIAAVSLFEISTRPEGEEVATRVQVEGGKLAKVSEAGGPAGTRVTVKNLFFNLPARQKFLRKPQTELGHCTETVIRQLLIHPEVDVEVTHEGRRLIRAPVHASLNARAAALLGATGRQLMPIAATSEGIAIEGLIAPIGVHRGTGRGSSYHYVNGRHVQDPVLRRAVAEAYRGLVPRGRYPVVVLRIEVPGEEVDVNVHPAKTEVRFGDALRVSRAITQSIRNALGHIEQSPEPMRPEALSPTRQVHLGLGARSESLKPPPPPEPVVTFDPPPILKRPAPSRAPEKPPLPRPERNPLNPRELKSTAGREPVEYFGDLASDILVFRIQQDLWLVDRTQLDIIWTTQALVGTSPGESRPLLAPCIIDLEVEDYRGLKAHINDFASLGLVIEDFGSPSLIVKSVPPVLGTQDLAEVLRHVARSPALKRGGCNLNALAYALASSNPGGQSLSLSPYELCQRLREVQSGREQIGFKLAYGELRDRLSRKVTRRG